MVALGVDIGFGYTKVLSSEGNSVVFPSAVGQAETVRFKPDLQRHLHAQSGGVITLDGISYFYGEPALRHSRTVLHPRDRGWIQSLPYRVLWAAVVEALLPSYESDSPTIVTGLPVDFYQDKEALEKIVQEVLAQKQVKAYSLTVIPQPFGSFFDTIMNTEGRVEDEKRAVDRLGIVDIGYFTTDFLEVRELELIQKRSGTVTVGVATVLDAIRRHVYETWQRPMEVDEAEEVLNQGKVRVRGEEHDLRPIHDAAVSEVSSAIVTHARQFWGGGETLDAIIATGGGREIFRPALSHHFPHLLLPSRPFMANAQGFLKYALYLGGMTR
jgi:plasmid segregation protein ParM